MKQFECLEAACGRTFAAEDDEELVRLVQRHVAEVHRSVELEDVILAGARRVDPPEPSG